MSTECGKSRDASVHSITPKKKITDLMLDKKQKI